MKAEQSLSRLAATQPDGHYDVVLVDAPYGDPRLAGALEALGNGELLSARALVVVEHSRRTTLAEVYGALRLLRQRRHGDTEVSIYGKPRGGDLGTRDLSGQV
jgi:16S rRNA (guanine966-N2)-methyltransferase